jgi:hypothetical protein
VISARDLARLRQAQRKLSQELLHGPLLALRQGRRPTRREDNVVAVEIGERFQRGQPTYEWCLRVVVRHKFKRMPVHVADRLPRSVAGLAVDVIQAGSPAQCSACLSDPRKPYPTPPGMLGGLSIGPRRSQASDGTAGLVVRRHGDQHRYLLTNRHVVHMPGTKLADLDGRVQQPGRSSQGRVIGLYDEQLLLPLETGGAVNLADAALVRLQDQVAAAEGRLNCLGEVSAVLLDPAALRTEIDRRASVTLSGSRSRGSAGTLFGFEASLKVNYPSGLFAVFSGQLSIRPVALDPQRPAGFAQKGDSGALIVMPTSDDGLVAVGLLHSVAQDLVYAAPLLPIWEHFNIAGLETV